MTLGRADSARRTLRVLEARLADVGAEAEQSTHDILAIALQQPRLQPGRAESRLSKPPEVTGA